MGSFVTRVIVMSALVRFNRYIDLLSMSVMMFMYKMWHLNNKMYARKKKKKKINYQNLSNYIGKKRRNEK